MNLVRKILRLVLNKYFAQKIIAYTLLLWVFYFLQNFLLIFFLTFIFAYLFFSFWTFIKTKLDSFFAKFISHKKYRQFLIKITPLNLIILFLYVFFTGFFIYTLIDLPPKLTRELTDIHTQIPALAEPIKLVNTKLIELKNINTELGKSFSEIFNKQDIDIILQIYEKAKDFWFIFLKVIISLVLSYIFIIDRNKLKDYLKTIQKSNFWFFYDEYKIIFEKIVKTFWAAFKAQSFIALANSILTTIWLLIIGWANLWQTYPFIYTLALIVFICWFIPFVGLFISSIPVFIIGYTMVWWVSVVVQIIVLLIIINLIETYYLNPKIVSSMIHLPISLTFVVLLVSEHYLWFAWLIIWIWIFYLSIELLKDTDKIITKSKIALSDMNTIEQETKNHIKKWIRVSRKVD